MKNLYKYSFIHSISILAYIALVALVMQNGDQWFGQMNNFIGPIAFLLLFTLSALVVGLLGLGKPIILYLDGKKKEAITLILLTVANLFALTLIALVIASLCK